MGSTVTETFRGGTRTNPYAPVPQPTTLQPTHGGIIMSKPQRCERERRGESHATDLSWRPTRYGFFWLCPSCWEIVQAELHGTN